MIPATKPTVEEVFEKAGYLRAAADALADATAARLNGPEFLSFDKSYALRRGVAAAEREAKAALSTAYTARAFAGATRGTALSTPGDEAAFARGKARWYAEHPEARD